MSSAVTGLTSVFLSSAASITAGALMINMNKNYGKLTANGTLSCTLSGTGTSANCALQGSYGDGILAVNIISVVLNGILFLLMLMKWSKAYHEKHSGLVKASFGMISLAVMMAVAAAGYNLYIQHNFGKEEVNGNLGSNCTVSGGCTSVSGTVGNIILGLNSTAIALSSLAMIFHSTVVARELQAVERRF